jgi:O-antigen ligase
VGFVGFVGFYLRRFFAPLRLCVETKRKAGLQKQTRPTFYFLLSTFYFLLSTFTSSYASAETAAMIALM